MESPVQLLNVLEWVYADRRRAAGQHESGPASADGRIPAPASGEAAVPGPAAEPGPGAAPGPPAVPGPAAEPGAAAPGDAVRPAPDGGRPTAPGSAVHPTPDTPNPGTANPDTPTPDATAPFARRGAGPSGSGGITVVVLSPTDPMTRGQLRRMAELARDEGLTVRWEEARGGAGAPFQTIGSLAPALRRAARIVIGDPFSRYVQLLLTLARARDLVVVDDGTATMEFVAQLARGERLVRWHRTGRRGGAREAVFAPVAAAARRRLTPRRGHRVEVFSSMPVEPPDGVTVTGNAFAWTRARFGPPQLTRGSDLVGTSLAETGVVDLDRYIEAVGALARAHGATRYFAHRRESAEKLRRLSEETGLEIVRPDLPLELIARRGPIGRTILSFPSTVVHTLPLALAGTEVKVAVFDIDPAWLTDTASPRAQGFLSGVTGSARDVHRLDSLPASAP
ncbi:hypothetical protein ACFYYR_11775 [Streptomyces sp. NPDC001922]|uniref:hypothetical protein n=1 Tax=Streptomyces sp. NPDC001922 TaxID=3364624 RepID=UPI003685C225